MSVKLLVLMVHIRDEVAEGDEFDLVHEVIDQAVASIGLPGVRKIEIYTVTDQP